MSCFVKLLSDNLLRLFHLGAWLILTGARTNIPFSSSSPKLIFFYFFLKKMFDLVTILSDLH